MPKALRDELGLAAGQALEIAARDGRLEMGVPPTPMRLRREKAYVAEPGRDLPLLTADAVRETLEHVRR